MINGDITHPEILKTLAGIGHGAKILIADGHFPFLTGAKPEATRVYLNFAPGMLNVPDILRQIVKCIDIEAAAAPVPDNDQEPPIFKEYRELLPKGMAIEKLKRFGFYDAVNSHNTALVIASADVRTYACILLTVGIRKF